MQKGFNEGFPKSVGFSVWESSGLSNTFQKRTPLRNDIKILNFKSFKTRQTQSLVELVISFALAFQSFLKLRAS